MYCSVGIITVILSDTEYNNLRLSEAKPSSICGLCITVEVRCAASLANAHKKQSPKAPKVSRVLEDPLGQPMTWDPGH